MVEKPLIGKAEELEILKEEQQKRNVTLYTAYNYRFEPHIIKLKELIDNNLSEEGYIVIEVPLFDSIQSKISRNKWLHLDPPVHYSHFTRETLLKLLRGWS